MEPIKRSLARPRPRGRQVSGALGAALGAILVGALLVPTVAAQAPPVPTPPGGPEAVTGSWLGSLALPGDVMLRIIIHIEAGEEGALSATADSPDQGVRGIPVTEASFEEGELVLEMATIGARFVGSPGTEGSIEGGWSQGGQTFPLRLERAEGEVVGPPRPQEPEPPFPYRTEEVRYLNPKAGIHLAGTLTLPEGEGPFPAAVLISGSGAQNRDSEVFGHHIFLVLADYLTRQGIAVLRSDDRGVEESEGVFAEATSQDFAGDAAAASAWLRTHPEIDPSGVGFVGLSEGGLIAPMVAAEHDEVAFIVLMAGPGLPGEEILYLQGELIARAGGQPEEFIAWNRGVQEGLFSAVKEEEDESARAQRMRQSLDEAMGRLGMAEREAMGLATPEARDGWMDVQISAVRGPWFRFFLAHDPRPVLRHVQVPVLALFGELDLQVPPSGNLEAMEAALDEAGNPDVTVRELPGLNHLFQTARTGSPAEYAQIEETMSPEAMEIVARWILERVGGGGGGT